VLEAQFQDTQAEIPLRPLSPDQSKRFDPNDGTGPEHIRAPLPPITFIKPTLAPFLAIPALASASVRAEGHSLTKVARAFQVNKSGGGGQIRSILGCARINRDFAPAPWFAKTQTAGLHFYSFAQSANLIGTDWSKRDGFTHR